jgi:hypothetical protein
LLIWLRCSPSISFWNDIRRLVEFLPCFWREFTLEFWKFANSSLCNWVLFVYFADFTANFDSVAILGIFI